MAIIGHLDLSTCIIGRQQKLVETFCDRNFKRCDSMATAPSINVNCRQSPLGNRSRNPGQTAHPYDQCATSSTTPQDGVGADLRRWKRPWAPMHRVLRHQQAYIGWAITWCGNQYERSLHLN